MTCLKCKRLEARLAKYEGAKPYVTPQPVDGLDLTSAQLALVQVLMSEDRWFDQREIWERICNTKVTDVAVVKVHICHVRKKLKAVGVQFDNRHGYGWKFSGRSRAKLARLMSPTPDTQAA